MAFVIQPRLLLVVGIIVLLLGAFFVAFFFLPSARVVVRPVWREKTAEQSILLSVATTEPDFKKFILPAQVVEAEAEAQQTITREGGAATPGKATGVVRLVNKQAEEQPLLPKSHLRHEATGVFFLTDTAVRIPPQGELMVAVTAKEEGVSGNVPAGKFIVDKLPSSLQAVVYGESSTPFSGGEVFDTPLSADELQAAQERSVQEAQERARGELDSKAGGADIRDDLISETIEEKTASVAPGSRAASYSVSARVRQRAFVVDDTALLSLTLLALQASPGPDEEFVEYVPESFSATIVRADFERGEARVTGRLTGSFAQKTESKIFETKSLAGRTPAEVTEYFKQFPSVASVEIHLSPFWAKSLPARPGAVEVEVGKK